MSLPPSFDPHTVHFFTSASSTPANSLTSSGLPISTFPGHVLAASTSGSPSRVQPPMDSSFPNQQQSTLGLLLTQKSPIPMQSPQPRLPAQTRGFAVGAVTPAAMGQKATQTKSPIFEPFKHERALTPELNDVIKKKSAQWNQWELEQTLDSN